MKCSDDHGAIIIPIITRSWVISNAACLIEETLQRSLFESRNHAVFHVYEYRLKKYDGDQIGAV